MGIYRHFGSVKCCVILGQEKIKSVITVKKAIKSR